MCVSSVILIGTDPLEFDSLVCVILHRSIEFERPHAKKEVFDSKQQNFDNRKRPQVGGAAAAMHTEKTVLKIRIRFKGSSFKEAYCVFFEELLQCCSLLWSLRDQFYQPI